MSDEKGREMSADQIEAAFTTKPKRAKKTKPAKKALGIGKFARKLMATTKKTNNEILAAILKKFPTAKTTYACIAWYRSKINQESAQAGE